MNFLPIPMVRTLSSLFAISATLVVFCPAAEAYMIDDYPQAMEYYGKEAVSETPEEGVSQNRPSRRTILEQKENSMRADYVSTPELLDRLLEESEEQNGYTSDTVTRADLIEEIIGQLYADRPMPFNCYRELSPSDYWLLFSDVEVDASYALELCAAMIGNLIDGYPDTTFRPNQAVNIAEASKILVKANGMGTDESDPSIMWYEPYVAVMREHDALPENEPLDTPVTRSWLTRMIERLRAAPAQN
jgi:hypothetical protein